MNKKAKIAIFSAVLLLIIVLAGLVIYFVLYKKPSNQANNPKIAKYFIANSISPTDTQKIKDSIYQASKGYELIQTDIISDASIIIQDKSGEGFEALYSEPSGEPQKLLDGEIIKTIEKPKYYIKISQNYDSNLKTNIKDNYSKGLDLPTNWTMKIAGDIIIGRTVYEQEMRRNDYTSSFALVKDFLKDADYTVADAEWTAADGIVHPLQGMSFSSPAKSLDGLTYAGIDAVSLANNHSMNGGVSAFEQMLGNLTDRKIGYFGAGRNFNQAHTAYIADVKGLKVAFLGYTAIPGNYEAGSSSTGNAFVKIEPWYPFNEEYVAQVEKDIKLAKTKADIVIPYFHWSQEYVHEPNEQMRTLAHRAVDAGATMVVGSHPHWVQGIEWYKDTLIAYSLGNFVFDQEQSMKTKQGVVLSTQFSGGKLIGAQLVPIQIEQYFQPHLLDGAGATQVLQNIFSSSKWIN